MQRKEPDQWERKSSKQTLQTLGGYRGNNIDEKKRKREIRKLPSHIGWSR